MSAKSLSRRAFIQTASASAGSALLMLSSSSLLLAGKQAHAAMLEGDAFATLSPDEAAELAAVAARIIPTDETPGATEAGVIYFMDNVLTNLRQDWLPGLQEGLALLQAEVNSRFATEYFYELAPSQQDSLLTDMEDSAFFNTVHYLTIAGMFASPNMGGNRDRLGWQMLGFEDQHAWLPPYGYYDQVKVAEGE